MAPYVYQLTTVEGLQEIKASIGDSVTPTKCELSASSTYHEARLGHDLLRVRPLEQERPQADARGQQ